MFFFAFTLSYFYSNEPKRLEVEKIRNCKNFFQLYFSESFDIILMHCCIKPKDDSIIFFIRHSLDRKKTCFDKQQLMVSSPNVTNPFSRILPAQNVVVVVVALYGSKMLNEMSNYLMNFNYHFQPVLQSDNNYIIK